MRINWSEHSRLKKKEKEEEEETIAQLSPLKSNGGA
jgi:hypothetical protein